MSPPTRHGQSYFTAQARCGIAMQLPAHAAFLEGREGDRTLSQPQEGGSVRVFTISCSDRSMDLIRALVSSVLSLKRVEISSCKCHSFGESSVRVGGKQRGVGESRKRKAVRGRGSSRASECSASESC